MNNLKKVLALGLALVMLLGMFTIASAAEDKMVAADLADWDTVSHKDAVSLMVDLGIIKGIESEGKVNFQPEGNIDRASWAKMVYFAATGSEDADAYLGTASNLTDIAGNWAESYISYLAANKYISGDGTGHYNPSNNVTVAEACKMMLTVLGYDAEDRGYQNTAAWAGNILVDAKREGLMDNVDAAQTALVPLTRENAAEIVLNTLNANTVITSNGRDNGEKYVMSYTKSSTLGYNVFGMVKVTATVDDLDSDGMAIFRSGDAEVYNLGWASVCNFISNKVRATATQIGEKVDVYVKAENFKWKDEDKGDLSVVGNALSVISSAVAKASSTPIKVVTAGCDWSNVTNRSSSDFVASNKLADDAIAWYYNGKLQNDNGTTAKNAMKHRGTVTEFYDDDDGYIATVKVYEYTVDQVENGDVATKTLSDGTIQVRVPGVTNGWVDADKVTGWQGLVEDDVVLFYTTKLGETGNIYAYTIEKAEKITGKVTTSNTKCELTINGSRYKGSEQKSAFTVGDVNGVDVNDKNDVFADWGGTYNLADEWDFYLDKNGSIVAAVQLTETASVDKTCLVLQTEIPTDSIGVTNSLKAELLFVDGTTEIVDVTKVNDMNVVKEVKNADRQVSRESAQATLAGSNDAAVLQKFFSYRATSSGYELTELNAGEGKANRDWEDVETVGNGSEYIASVEKKGTFAKEYGNINVDLAGWATRANNDTTFIVGKRNSNDDTMTYTTYKGFRNVPAMDASMLTAISAHTKGATTADTVATFVYVETSLIKDDVPDGYVFIRSNTVSRDPELADDDVFVVDIIDVDGTPTTMRISDSVRRDIVDDSMIITDEAGRSHVGNFFAIGEIDENGVVSRLTNGQNVADNEKAVYLETLETLGGGIVNGYDYDDATKFVYVDMGWTDNDETNNKPGEREPALDKIDFKDSGTFSPEGFFNSKDVNATENTASYISVQVAVICPTNETTADYVYVLRNLW